MKELDRILIGNDKAELLETIKDELMAEATKGVVILVSNNDDGSYQIRVKTFGIDYNYESYGILEAAKIAMQQEEPNE